MSTICDCGGVIDLDDTLVQTTRDLGGKHEHVERLTFAPGAREFISRYGRYCALVSAGEEHWQQLKLAHLKLAGCFREIHIVPQPPDKAVRIREIVRRWEIPFGRLTVIGDRPDVEIKAGNELGILTVRVTLPGGRYSDAEVVGLEQATFTASDFHQVQSIMDALMFFE